MEVNGKLHAPTASSPGKPLPVPKRYEAGWAPEHVSTLWRRENLTPVRIPTPDVQPVARRYYFFNSNSGGWSPIGSTRYCGHQLAYCANPGWLWWWRNLLNYGWQRKPKYSEKACFSATLSTTNLIRSARTRTRTAAVGRQRLTAWAMARP
jgi:hypothetical protein